MKNNNHTLLDALTCCGVLISVSIRYWRARKKLTPEDLGLKQDQVNDRLISLGHKRLLPKDALQRLSLVESRAHAHIENNTFPFLGGMAHYVPNAKLEDVMNTLHNLESEFEACRMRFLSEYDVMREQAMRDWAEAAENLPVDRERLLAVIRDAFPERDQVDRRFAFDIRTFQITVPESVPAAELVDIGTQREIIEARKHAVSEARQEIESSCREFVADCAATLREQTAKLCSEMLTTINSTGYIHQKTLNRLVNFIDRFKELNFMNDTEMAQQLDNVRREFLTRTAQEYRDSRSAKSSLMTGLKSLRNRASEMAREDADGIVEGFGQLGRRRFELAA